MYYQVTFDESDGNDCTVYESTVQADSGPDALNKLADAIESAMIANETVFEPDGSEFGYYFNCPDDCETLTSLDDCDSMEPCGVHTGGISLRGVTEHATESEARDSRSRFHNVWDSPGGLVTHE